MINYKKILLYYIDHVGVCEGTNFIGSFDCYEDELSLEEVEELHRLGKIKYDDIEQELVINDGL